MVTKAFSAAAIAALAVAVAACGGKDKQDSTTPDTDSVSSSGLDSDSESSADSDGSDTGSDTGGNSGPDLTDVIYFEFDSSSLGDEARRQLQQNAEWMKADDSRKLTIEGHTDESGTPEYNLALGERRAQAVHQYLLQLGISEKRIEILTFGEERPAGEEDSENRRSVFVPLN